MHEFDLTVVMVAAALALVHLLSPWIHDGLAGRRGLAESIGSGAATAYVFLTLIPEIAHGQVALGELLGFVMLASFVVYYALDRWAVKLSARFHRPDFRLKLILACVYSFLIVVGLPSAIEESPFGATIGAIAIGLHCLSADHSFVAEDREQFTRWGRWALAGAAGLGAIGDIFLGGADEHHIDLVTAILAGSVLLTLFRDEFGRTNPRFWLFAGGAATYAALIFAKLQF